ncbi:hypothetical protein LOD99_9622 [Oopsacas minuta]|uniref:Uncharacterized protein n=1 Tax=Oopsacas minuta TaxID=111878 RepID=A0AAV7JSP5_9METZ|nr:hypothetical protein LOD99_5049 [Oopsacas minuta]KAI6662035.1 hypothetical protein LOD99_9622 [Oopsacas minuta]
MESFAGEYNALSCYIYTESDHPPIYPSSSPTLSPPRVKQQARARINEKFEESLNMSPSSSRASSPDRIQQEVHYTRVGRFCPCGKNHSGKNRPVQNLLTG